MGDITYYELKQPIVMLLFDDKNFDDVIFSDRLRSETVIFWLKLHCINFQTDTAVFILKLFVTWLHR